eukprot:366273-Chlamydomonas_euryale.AAC.10
MCNITSWTSRRRCSPATDVFECVRGGPEARRRGGLSAHQCLRRHACRWTSSYACVVGTASAIQPISLTCI